MATISRAEDWDAEYERKGIPSSFRNEPSGSVEEFLALLNTLKFTGLNAVDIGCGTGRNSISLAQEGYKVSAFDFSPTAVEIFALNLKNDPLERNITVRHHNVTKPWPITDSWADIAIDTFCFKHQIPMKDRLLYISELRRSLREGGIYLLTLADIDDGYYKKFLRPDLGFNVIVDPANNIPSVLYSKTNITEIFHGFELIHYQEKRKPSIMHGEIHDRVTNLFVLRNLC